MAPKLDTRTLSEEQLEFIDNMPLLAVDAWEDGLNKHMPCGAKQDEAAVNWKPVDGGPKMQRICVSSSSSSSVLHVAGNKSATNKKPDEAKNDTVAPQEEPIDKVREYYKTVATLHSEGDLPMYRLPHMLIEVREDAALLFDMQVNFNRLRVLGEVRCDGTIICGEGIVKKRRREIQTRVFDDDNGDWELETCFGQCYGGFISAVVTPAVSGSCFAALHVDPKLDPDLLRDSDIEDEPRPPLAMGTQDGDVICKFKIESFNAMREEPLVFTHLLRPLQSHAIEMQRTLNDVFNAYSGEPASEKLSRMVQCVGNKGDAI
jgi:hypothetical protein